MLKVIEAVSDELSTIELMAEEGHMWAKVVRAAVVGTLFVGCVLLGGLNL